MTNAYQAIAIKAEQAGQAYYLDHPCADRATVDLVARNKFASVLEQQAFVGGWAFQFWSEHVTFANN